MPPCASSSAELRQVRLPAKLKRMLAYEEPTASCPPARLAMFWWELKAVIIPFPRENGESDSLFSSCGYLHHFVLINICIHSHNTVPELSVGYGILSCPWGSVRSLPVTVVNFSSDFLLELSQFIFGKSPRQDLRPPFYQTVSHLLDMTELRCLVILQKTRDNFKPVKAWKL